MFTKPFLIQTVERAVKTFAQTVVALAGASKLDWLSLDWPQLLATAGIAAILSILSSVASDKIGPANTPSIVPVYQGP